MAAVADSSRMTKGGVVEISPLSELTQLLVGKVMMNVRTCDSLPFPKHQPDEMRPNLDIAH